jgi:hypothetical protein
LLNTHLGGKAALGSGRDVVLGARRIFIGSSHEASSAAAVVATAIERVGLEPMIWSAVFPAGDVLLERIEQLPDEVDGAILLATPDVDCRRGDERFLAPVANVIFEYGYLVDLLADASRSAPSTMQGCPPTWTVSPSSGPAASRALLKAPCQKWPREILTFG